VVTKKLTLLNCGQLLCLISLAPPNGIEEMIVFTQVFLNTHPACHWSNKTDSPTPNLHHWLSQWGWAGSNNKQCFDRSDYFIVTVKLT